MVFRFATSKVELINDVTARTGIRPCGVTEQLALIMSEFQRMNIRSFIRPELNYK